MNIIHPEETASSESTASVGDNEKAWREDKLESHEDGKHKYKNKKKKEKDMTQAVDLNSVGGGFGFPFGGFGGGCHHDGMGGILGVALLAGLLGNRRGFGDGGDCDGHGNGHALLAATMNAGFDGINHNINGALDSLNNAAVLGKLGSIEGAIPAAGLQVQNALLEQTIGFNNQLNASTLASLAATANVKDTVQNSLVATLAAGNTNTNMILAAVQGVKDQATTFRIADLERQLGVAQVLARDNEFHRRLDGVEVNVSQNVNQNQAQAQAQQQQQLQTLLLQGICKELSENTQISRATNANLIIGSTGVATGAQTANPVNVKG